ncbi:hypothetical protein B0H14DRAFT_2558673 [Mycena olivaceomarginata]|nr:hypothetical protein B0H14DRAFT_2558673 [Mycena olivaceomarginata]
MDHAHKAASWHGQRVASWEGPAHPRPDTAGVEGRTGGGGLGEERGGEGERGAEGREHRRGGEANQRAEVGKAAGEDERVWACLRNVAKAEEREEGEGRGEAGQRRPAE